MSRPLRLEFPDALYHVTSRGDRKAAIYLDRTDRLVWLSILDTVCTRYNFVVHGFCQMTNHYHVIIETIEGNLTQGMRQLNGLYSQYFNRRHGLVGHVFQGRYKGILVQRESYLLELTRYVVLNPVRGGLVQRPEDWPWSSYRFAVDPQGAPSWLDTHSTLGHFSNDPAAAVEAYREFIIAGIGGQNPLLKIRHQLILGDDEFIAKTRAHAASDDRRSVIRPHRRAVSLTLDEYARRYPARDEAMAHAYHSTAYTMEQIARHFGVSSKTVSRAINKKKLA